MSSRVDVSLSDVESGYAGKGDGTPILLASWYSGAFVTASCLSWCTIASDNVPELRTAESACGGAVESETSPAETRRVIPCIGSDPRPVTSPGLFGTLGTTILRPAEGCLRTGFPVGLRLIGSLGAGIDTPVDDPDARSFPGSAEGKGEGMLQVGGAVEEATCGGLGFDEDERRLGLEAVAEVGEDVDVDRWRLAIGLAAFWAVCAAAASNLSFRDLPWESGDLLEPALPSPSSWGE